MKKIICHDLKTERSNVLPPLPAVARVLPLGFFAAVAGAIVLSGFYFWQLRQAESDKRNWLSMEQSEKSQQDNIAKTMGVIAADQKRAEEVRKWLQGSKGIQQLITSVARSMNDGSTISELRMTRQANNPEQIYTVLRLNEGGPLQLEETLRLLESDTGYRPFDEETKGKLDTGEIDFNAKLIRIDG
jgi:hypothetical protein